jgi:uncharacterized protein
MRKRMEDHGRSRAIALFLLATVLISSVFYFLIIKSGHMGGGLGAYVAGLMWSPGFAALLTCKYLGRDVGSLGWKWGETRYEVISYFIPLCYATVIYGFVWLTGIGGVYRKDFVDAITKSFGLGPMPAWASISLYFVFTGTFTVTGFRDRHRRRDWLAWVPGSRACEDTQFRGSRPDQRIHPGDLALPGPLVC